MRRKSWTQKLRICMQYYTQKEDELTQDKNIPLKYATHVRLGSEDGKGLAL